MMDELPWLLVAQTGEEEVSKHKTHFRSENRRSSPGPRGGWFFRCSFHVGRWRSSEPQTPAWF